MHPFKTVECYDRSLQGNLLLPNVNKWQVTFRFLCFLIIALPSSSEDCSNWSNLIWVGVKVRLLGTIFSSGCIHMGQTSEHLQQHGSVSATDSKWTVVFVLMKEHVTPCNSAACWWLLIVCEQQQRPMGEERKITTDYRRLNGQRSYELEIRQNFCVIIWQIDKLFYEFWTFGLLCFFCLCILFSFSLLCSK